MKNLLSLVICFFTFQLQAADSLSTKISSPYTSFRALGMGDAFTAVADDYSLIFYNPAGFAKKKTNEVQFSIVGAGISPKTLTLMDDVKKASDTQGTDQQKADAISTALEPYYGKSLGGKVQAIEMFWIRKNWGVSLIPVDLTIDMSIDRQLGPSIDLNVKGDTIFAYGYGTEIGENLSMGVTGKYVHRVAVEQSVSALELATDSNVLSSKRFKEGHTVDFDLGFLWSPAWFGQTVTKIEKPVGLKVESKIPAEEKRQPQAEVATEAISGDTTKAPELSLDAAEKKPEEKKAEETPAEKKVEEKPVVTEIKKDNLPLTFGLVVHNILGGNFSKTKMVNKDATEAPTKMYRLVDIGSQYVISEWGDLTIRSMLDFKNLLHPEITFNKSFHAGLEFDYSPSGWFKTQLRGGINQMYYTAGVTLLLGVLNIEAVTYGEEVGTVSQKLENRVYGAKIGMNF